jgi:hypothetical protein
MLGHIQISFLKLATVPLLVTSSEKDQPAVKRRCAACATATGLYPHSRGGAFDDVPQTDIFVGDEAG